MIALDTNLPVQDERILSEKRRYRDHPFDLHPIPSTNVADLDWRLFEDGYLPAAIAPDVLVANDRTYEQRLAATKMIASVDEPVPAVLGMLILGRRTQDYLPGAYIQFLRIAGRDLVDPVVDELVVDGRIQDVLRQIDDKLIAHNRTAVDFTSGPIEKRTSTYPLYALQQLIRNAVMHRAYQATNAPVPVYWYDDWIEITSPGGPYGEVTPENFGNPPPEFDVQPTIVRVIVRPIR